MWETCAATLRRTITSKSSGLGDTAVVSTPACSWFYCQPHSGCGWGLQSAPNVSHYPVWKPSSACDSSSSSSFSFFLLLLSFFFLQVHTSVETWYFIFHSGLWMSLRADGGFTCKRPTCCLWSARPRLIADGEQMKGISADFMGVAHDGPSCPELLHQRRRWPLGRRWELTALSSELLRGWFWGKLMQCLGFNPCTEAVTSALSTGKHNIYAPRPPEEKNI